MPTEPSDRLPIDEPTTAAERASVWRRLGAGVVRTVDVACRTSVRAVRNVDRDAGRHLLELPALGLVTLAGLRRAREIERRPDDWHRPLILVHGLGGHPGNFAALRAWLGLQGRRRVYAPRLDPATSIEEMGTHLAETIADVLLANDLPDDAQVDLIAHSMGGLVARCALDDPATARRVSTLVTLGTPHAGSLAARFSSGGHAVRLRPESPLMTRLADQLPWSSPVRLVCFWSRSDLLLLPHTTGRVEHAENREVPGLTHYGYLLYPSVWRGVAEALADPWHVGGRVAPQANPA